MDEKAKGSIAVLAVLLLLEFSGLVFPSSQYVIGLLPGKTLTSRPQLWAFVTAGLYDNSYLLTVVNTVMVYTMGPLCESAWGTIGILRYLLFVNAVTFLGAFLCLIFSYMSLMDDRILFDPFFGCSALRMALAVGTMQQMTDRPYTRYIPLSALCVHVFLVIIGVLGLNQIFLALSGLVLGWLFLRFTMRYQPDNIKGDRSEEFAFPKLFPEWPPLQASLVFLSSVVELFLKKLGWCKNAGSQPQTVMLTPAIVDTFVSKTQPLTDPTADRRRAMAIKAIDAKLAQLGGGDDTDVAIDLNDDNVLMGLDAIDSMVAEAEIEAGVPGDLELGAAELASATLEADVMP